MVDELNEVQPIDGYVRGLLEYATKKYNIKIDLNGPTRGQRLEVALAMKNEEAGFYSIEIMVGRRVSSDDPKDQPLHFMLLTQGMFPQDPRRFYEGFAHQYWPEGKESKGR